MLVKIAVHTVEPAGQDHMNHVQ